MLNDNPYRYSADDVLFQVFAWRNDIPETEQPEARRQFFAKEQACMRSSPLAKRYGWGIHNDSAGKIALHGRQTAAYQAFLQDDSVKVAQAMRSSRKK